MESIITYTTVGNQKLDIVSRKIKSHEFKNNVGYITLAGDEIPLALFEGRPIKTVIIPDGVEHIASYTFWECTALESVVLPNSVTKICEHAFHGCASLTNIVLPNKVAYIGCGAFMACHGLTSIELPNSLEYIDCGVFRGCWKLLSIKIPNSVTHIGYDAFSGCRNLPCCKVYQTQSSLLAYKGFNKDMQCRNFQYEFNKSYHEEKVKQCTCGFHACLNPLDVLSYYLKENGSRFALVELRGNMDLSAREDSKVSATDITVLKELSFTDLINEFNRLNSK